MFRTGSVFCHFCSTEEKKGNLKDQRNKEYAYITKGFSSWKKAPKCFQSHQDTACHRAASAYQLLIPKCQDIAELMDNQLLKKREVERKYLIEVIKCLRYLARQGIALQGHDGNDNFTQLLRLIGTKDSNITDHLEGKIGHKYTHNDVQNELLDIMAVLTLQEKLKLISGCKFFSIIADEGTDVSNKEQLSFCLRTVDQDLNPSEDFIGFYELENIKSDTIVRVMKDILIRTHLSLDNCRGQTYDGASNMMGKKSGVSTQILMEQPKAVAIHCQGHSLSLSVKSLTSECAILRDVMAIVGEVCVLIKYSPKRENLLGKIYEYIESEDSQPLKKLKKLSTTRWTVRAECFKRIIDNYQSLLDLWSVCLKEKLDQETKARIAGCKTQMESFYFYFGVNLGYKLYSMTDNLSKSLQSTKMSALKGKTSANLVIETLGNMRNDEDFMYFYEMITKASKLIPVMNPPILPRKRKRPNYSILQYAVSYEGQENNAYYSSTPYDYYKLIYFETLDAITNAITDRFEQPALKRFINVEEMLLKAIKKIDASEEMKIIESDFYGDFNPHKLKSELDILPTIFKQSVPIDFRDICNTLQEMDKEQRPLIENVWTIIRLVLTSGATSATPERSFSLQRRIKTWLRSTMSQKRYNALSVLNEHKEILDKISLIEVGNRFIATQDKRKYEFGTFTENDIL